MAKSSSVYVCQSCSYQTAKWMGRCPECSEWNSLVEELMQSDGKGSGRTKKEESTVYQLKDVTSEQIERVTTGIGEFDRVIGGGLVMGSLILIGGEPGIGKSTLLLQVIGALSKKKKRVLYVSGEESLSQVAGRAKRLEIGALDISIVHENEWTAIKEIIRKCKPEILVVDSIQTTTTRELDSPPGSVSQVREVTYELMNHVKATGITCFVIGHITKEGAIAGPKILEHMVDTVIYFEGDQFGHYRLLRAIKNRFGNTNEVGIFEMGERGLHEIKNPSQLFLDGASLNSFGRAISCIVEGSRTLLIELQALVVETKYGTGRRTTQGLDQNRLAMLVAVIEKYLGIPIGLSDIYLNVVGNMKLSTRESDLAIVAALLSSFQSKSLSDQDIYLGEVGLTGEVRTIPYLEMRLKELSQLNYRRVYLPFNQAEQMRLITKIEVVGVKGIKDFMNLLSLDRPNQ